MVLKLRIFGCITALAASASYANVRFQDGRLHKTVTLVTAGQTVCKTLEELNAKADVRLAVDSQLQSEIVAVRVKNVTLHDLMEKMAKAVTGRWDKTPEGYLLRVDPASVRSKEQRLRDSRAAALSNSKASFASSSPLQHSVDFVALARRTRSLYNDLSLAAATGKRSEAEFAELNKIAKSTPIERALSRMIAALPVDDLAGLRAGQRVVYSSRPTRLQRSMPEYARNVIGLLVEEHNAWARGLVDADSTVGNERSSSGIWRLIWPNINVRELKKEEAIIALSIARPQYEGPVVIKIELANAAGLLYGRAQASLATEPPDASLSHNGSTPLRFSPVAIELSRLLLGQFGSSEGGSAVPRLLSPPYATSASYEGKMYEARGRLPLVSSPQYSMNAELRIRNPDVFEPLAQTVGPALFAFIDDDMRQIVALLPDPLAVSTAKIASNKGTTGEFETALTHNGMKLVSEDGWTVVEANDPARVAATRFDRKALTRLILSGSKGLYTLDAICEYAITRPCSVGDTPGLDMRYLRCTEPRTVNAMLIAEEYSANMNAMRLIGSLNEAQRDALRTGGDVAITRDLSRVESECERILLGSNPPYVKLPNPAPSTFPEENRLAGATLGSIYSDPTFVFGGIDLATINLLVQDRMGCIAYRPDDLIPAILSADDVGYLTVNNQIAFSGYRPLQMEQWTLQLVSRSGATAMFQTVRLDYEKSSFIVGEKDLPLETRQRIEAARKAFSGKKEL